MITKEQKQGEELLKTLIQKAWNNPEFKNQLVTNPKETISKEIGKKFELPNGRQIIVEDQTDNNKIFLNIPPQQFNLDDFELTDEQLEQVSGGDLVTGGLIALAFVVGVVIGVNSD